MLSIPLEIVDNILCYLPNDSPSLKSSSLVCRSWAPLAQKRIFYKFELRCTEDEGDDGTQLCNRLLGILKETPHLALYFRNIELWLETSGTGPPSAPQLTSQESFHTLLRLFSRARRLCINGRFAWKCLAAGCLSSIQCLISNPNFETLSLGLSISVRCGELLSLLRLCANSLRCLEFDCWSRDDSPEDEENAIGEPVVLAKLNRLQTMSNTHPFHKNTVQIPNLQIFYRPFVLSPPFTVYSSKILFPCVPDTLPHLWLTLYYRGDGEIPSNQAPNFGEYINMRHLTLALPACDEKTRHAALRSLGYFFSHTPLKNILRLESVTIELVGEGYLTSSICNEPVWGVIDTCLMSLPDVGALNRIHLVSRLFPIGQDDGERDEGESNEEDDRENDGGDNAHHDDDSVGEDGRGNDGGDNDQDDDSDLEDDLHARAWTRKYDQATVEKCLKQIKAQLRSLQAAGCEVDVRLVFGDDD